MTSEVSICVGTEELTSTLFSLLYLSVADSSAGTTHTSTVTESCILISHHLGDSPVFLVAVKSVVIASVINDPSITCMGTVMITLRGKSSPIPQYGSKEDADLRKRWVQEEGTLSTRIRNTSLSDMAKNAALEIPRLANEAAMLPANVASVIGSGYKGIADLVTGGVDKSVQGIQNRPQFHGFAEPSMMGEVFNRGVDVTADTLGLEPGSVEFMKHILALGGVGSMGRGLSQLGKAGMEKTRPAPTELQTLSAEHGVPLPFGKEVNSPTANFLAAKLQRLPIIGTRGFMKEGGKSLEAAAKNIADEFSTHVEDPATTLVERFKSNLKKGKDEATDAYGQVKQALDESGVVAEIEPSGVKRQLKTLLAETPDIFDRLGPAQSKLKSIMQDIAGDVAPQKTTIPVMGELGITQPSKVLLDEFGKPIQKQVTPKLSYDDYVWLRDALGEYTDRAYNTAGAVGSKQLRQLTLIKKALDSDFYNWGKNQGLESVTNAVDSARTVYKTKVAPFDNIPILRQIVNGDFKPEALLDTIAKPRQATIAKRAMVGLRGNDVALVQDAIMRRALAIALEGAKDGAPISGAKFATFFEKMDSKTKNSLNSPMDIFFKPADKQRVMGFAKLSRAAEEYGQYTANPLNGSMGSDFVLPGAIAGTAGMVGIPSAISAAAATKAMSIMLTHPAGKAILHRAYRLPAGAKAAWESIIKDTTRILQDNRGLVGRDIGAIPWAEPQQKVTSANTSISYPSVSEKSPIIFSAFRNGKIDIGPLNADIGGGKYNQITDWLASKNIDNVVYDPFNRSLEHNIAAKGRLSGGQADTATISNVLNVIPEAKNRLNTIATAYDSIKPNGTAYFSMYTAPKEGINLKLNSYQLGKKPSEYIPEIEKIFGKGNVTMKNGIITAVKRSNP